MSNVNTEISKPKREISSIQSEAITSQGYEDFYRSGAVLGGRDFLDSLSDFECSLLDSKGVKVENIEFDYDFECREWAKCV